ncbi:MAG: citryl-CoA lyase [Burkholderiales bacterium]|nr:citryl-CoA lyase [Burkholderiales bacterium]
MSEPVFNSHIWEEQAEPTNPFAAATCRCRGYDVYGELLGKASYIDYIFLLFKGERPSKQASAVLELLAVALANPGPRDLSVHSAMAAGATGNPASATLIAALATGAGSYGGAREVLLAMENWRDCGTDLAKWKACLADEPKSPRPLIWPKMEHPAGFDPYGASCATPVLQTLSKLCSVVPDGKLAWLAENRTELEGDAGSPLAMSGVTAAAFCDIEFTPVEAEMLTLLLRLPGAAAHALEQRQRGFRQFPFFEVELTWLPASPRLRS